STEALGQSDAFLAFQERLSRVAPIQRPVLLVGERGTGKELAAARLHYLSGRWQKSFVTLNCASLSPSLIESELFGYERGAFTGALQRRVGRFEAADGGTLFLDEIGNVPKEVQEKILRAVEYQDFERVGSAEKVAVDVRILAATHANLPEMAATGQFRSDLLDRLSFEVLAVPPLRERAGDIKLLARHFAARMAREMERAEMPDFSPEAWEVLEGYRWPGNVRELKNVVERAVYRSDSPLIAEIALDPFGGASQRSATTGRPGLDRKSAQVPEAGSDPLAVPLKKAVLGLKMRMLTVALERSRYNQRKAAVLLGLSYDQVRGLYRRYQKLQSDDDPAAV
ncbi:MAG: phage shock protein operon transcriptional activator, partial [Desulfobacterales bacterium]|nr:phage shock protein operon transcriptional activator [Desulfobacterales bacterium]